MKEPGYKRRLRQLKTWARIHFYTIIYVGVFTILTQYILRNWTTCISMQFFSQFDGNNILFLVWISSIILFFYDVEAKGWKFHRKNNEETRKRIEAAESDFTQSQIQNIKDSLQYQESGKENGGANLK